jgi:hydroxymethylpyrimidine pyrophosphatase-like HAD family hydrolase
VRCLYVDLDGTLLGAGASLLHDGDGAISLLGVRALEACLRADVEVVIMSGRRRAQVMEPARLIGQPAYAFEAGAGVVVDGELHWITNGIVPDAERGTIHQQLTASGAPALLLAHVAGRLEEHYPWNDAREVSHVLRGLVDAGEADRLLREHGHEDLRLVDNGVIPVHSPTLSPDLPQVRAYHLVPVAASKAAAVALHARIRGYARQDCVAVGDSREDLGMAASVGTFWLVANALTADPTMAEAITAHDNVRVCEERNGAAVYEAVVTTLAGA